MCDTVYVLLYTGGVDPDQEDIDLRMGAIQHKILVLSGKGGNCGQVLVLYNILFPGIYRHIYNAGFIKQFYFEQLSKLVGKF